MAAGMRAMAYRRPDDEGIELLPSGSNAGKSKWNKIEHRLFSFISLTWKGQPLINYEMIMNLIGATKTKSGPRVKPMLDAKKYETGIR